MATLDLLDMRIMCKICSSAPTCRAKAVGNGRRFRPLERYPCSSSLGSRAEEPIGAGRASFLSGYLSLSSKTSWDASAGQSVIRARASAPVSRRLHDHCLVVVVTAMAVQRLPGELYRPQLPGTEVPHEFRSLFLFSFLFRRSTLFLCIFSAIFSYRSFSSLAARLSLILCTRCCEKKG